MRFLNNVFIVPSLIFTLANARCFPVTEHSESWKDKADAFHVVESACNDLLKNFHVGDTRSACFQGSKGQKYDFKVTMEHDPTNTGEYTLRYDECKNRFSTNVDRCERGGTTENKALVFTYVNPPSRCDIHYAG
jgi:hypothetical protein